MYFKIVLIYTKEGLWRKEDSGNPCLHRKKAFVSIKNQPINSILKNVPLHMIFYAAFTDSVQ